jgi:PE family protein
LLSEIGLRHGISGPVITKEQSMSFVEIVPEMLSVAAGNLQRIGSAVSAQNAAALGPTVGLVPAAADEVSALTALQFAAHAQMYQEVSAKATTIHSLFVTMLAASADSYASTEAANAVAAS